MKYESTIKDMKEIIANRFNIAEPQNIKISNSRRILLDVVKIKDIDNIHKLVFLVLLPVKKSTPKSAKLGNSMNKKSSKTFSKKISHEKCKYFYTTNKDDEIHEIEIGSDSTVVDFKEKIAEEYGIGDIGFIKVMFAGRDLLDYLILKDLEIGSMPLFVYIKPCEDILLLTAKSLRYTKNRYFDDDDDDDEEEEPRPSYSSSKSKVKKRDFDDAKESKSSSLKEKHPKPLQVLSSKVIKNLENKKLIGTGGTSSVYRVKSKDIINPNGKYLTLKVLNLDIFKDKKEVKKTKGKWKEDSDDDDDNDEKEEERELTEADFERIRHLLNEYELVNNLNHPNIIKTFGIYKGNDGAYPPSILLEYYRNTLADSIDDLEEIDRVLIIYEICDAMKYVHKENIIHRDLKPENILLDWNKHAKLCDFGIAKLIDVETQTSTLSHQLGTIPYMAPELLSDTGHYDRKVDVYAFGVILYFIIAKERPKNTVVNILAGKMTKIPSSFTDLARNLITKCWSFSPGDRPEFKDIIDMIVENNFMFFKGIKEKEIVNLKKRLKLI